MVNVLPHGPSPWSSNLGGVLFASIYRQGKQAGDLPRHAGEEGTCSGSPTLPRTPSSLFSSSPQKNGVSGLSLQQSEDKGCRRSHLPLRAKMERHLSISQALAMR